MRSYLSILLSGALGIAPEAAAARAAAAAHATGVYLQPLRLPRFLSASRCW